MAVVVERAHANPIVESLQGQVQIFVGLEFDDRETAVAIEGEQVEHAAIAGGECGNLRVELVATNLRQQIADPGAQFATQASARAAYGKARHYGPRRRGGSGKGARKAHGKRLHCLQ